MTVINRPERGASLLSATELAAKIAAGEITSVQATTDCLDRIDATDGQLHCFLHLDRDGALAQAAAIDARIAKGEDCGRLAGVPVAIKDVMVTKGMPTTSGSKILEGWIPPYDATVVANLKAAGAVIVGKTNMDEFAMGSSTEHSAYGPSHNPWDTERTPGGSGGGSSAAVAGFQVPLATGTDTGGSIRQPGAVTGTVGVKPTYGGISRYGMIALASSLDQAGPCARSVADCALMHEVMAGKDERDSTSLEHDWSGLVEAAEQGTLDGVKVGIVTELGGDGYQDGVKARFNESVELLKNAGAEIVEVSCPNFEYALAAYYLILPSEASSNLARFDAMRYGMRVTPAGMDESEASVEQVMRATRAAGFGDEVKRRIILGTYALSAGYYDAYYGSAQKVRTLVQQDFAAAFAKADVLISPTAPTTAFRLGERIDDPMAMYLNDIATIPANLAGVPGMSIPNGLADEDGLPTGLQILAPAYEDRRLYQVGGALERLLEESWGGPIHQHLSAN